MAYQVLECVINCNVQSLSLKNPYIRTHACIHVINKYEIFKLFINLIFFNKKYELNFVGVSSITSTLI